MSEEPNAITDDAPSPWWPCPNCLGSIHFKTVCTFERGHWVGDEFGSEWEAYSPADGTPTGIHVSDVECIQCGHAFDIARHYEWPIQGEYDSDTTS